MKKIFLALMAIAAIIIVGCNKSNEPESPENGRDHNVLLTDTNGANQANRVPTRMPLPETQSAK